MITIHPVGVEDRADWLALFEAYLVFYESDLDRETIDRTFARIVSATGEIHGAVARDDEGRAVGLVHWLTHPATWTRSDYCYLEDLFVVPDARRAGAGAALIEHVRDWATRHGSAKVYWLTADGNATARSLYDRVARRTGFIQYEIRIEHP